MRRLSRFRFVATAGTAFLAACSGGVSGSGSLPSAIRNNSLVSKRPTYTYATSGLTFSSNASGTAFAAHNSAGAFVASAVISSGFIRTTSGNKSQQILPLGVLASSSSVKLSSGNRMKQVTLKSAKAAILAEDTAGLKTLLHAGRGNMLYLRWKAGPNNGIRFNATAPSNATPQEAFLSLMSSVGTWTGDDDFIEIAKTLAPNTGLASTAAALGARSVRADDGDGDGDGDGGDMSYYIAMTPQQQCQVDQEQLTAAQLAYWGAVGAAVAACLTVETGVGALACAAAGVAVGAAGAALQAAQDQYNFDNCGTTTA